VLHSFQENFVVLPLSRSIRDDVGSISDAYVAIWANQATMIIL
jgi:hypothetical protein